MLEPAEQPAQVNAISTTTATRLGFPRRHLRVAWLAPSLARGWRWQAVFREFTKLFPETVVFTNIWPGFTPGFERSFKVRRLRGTKVLNIGSSSLGLTARGVEAILESPHLPGLRRLHLPGVSFEVVAAYRQRHPGRRLMVVPM